MTQPKLIIFAGANGSGKTTAAEKYLKEPNAVFSDFINTDKIAEGLSPYNPEVARVSAGKLFFERFHDYVEERKSFAIETTLSGSAHIKLIIQAKKAGYKVHMIYLYVENPLLNTARVELRVQQGGHNVPEKDIKRRYDRSLYNLMNAYWDICDSIEIYDTAYENRLIAHKTRIGVSYPRDDKHWKKIVVFRDERKD